MKYWVEMGEEFSNNKKSREHFWCWIGAGKLILLVRLGFNFCH